MVCPFANSFAQLLHNSKFISSCKYTLSPSDIFHKQSNQLRSTTLWIDKPNATDYSPWTRDISVTKVKLNRNLFYLIKTFQFVIMLRIVVNNMKPGHSHIDVQSYYQVHV